MRRLLWSQSAIADVDRFLDHIASDEDTDLAAIIARIEAVPETLLASPGIGPLTPSRRWRKWPVKGLPLILIYDVGDTAVTILRVVHARSDWAALL